MCLSFVFSGLFYQVLSTLGAGIYCNSSLIYDPHPLYLPFCRHYYI